MSASDTRPRAGPTFSIRPVENRDAPSLVDLVGRCFADYPGCVLDLEVEERDLLSPADSFERMWVAERDSDHRLAAMIAAKTSASHDEQVTVELKKLYIDHEARGQGLARRMVDLVETYARERGAAVVDLWSDTRFDKAHAVYTHFGWRMQRAVRDLHDLSNTREYYFTKRL